MTDDSRAYLALSVSDLAGAARDLAAGDPRLAVARAYYAAFHAAQAALASEGRTAKSHAGTRSLFSEVFVQTERVDRRVARTYGLLMDLRQQADYHVGGTLSRAEGERAVADAVLFVEAVEALLTGADE